MGQPQSTAAQSFEPPPPAQRLVITQDVRDFTLELPDECLAIIFDSLEDTDRKHCSLVCHRWLLVEAQTRVRLSLDARAELTQFIPSLFTRFDSVSKLVLRCDRNKVSISDRGLVLVAEHCVKLTRLKLRHCREITDRGIEEFAIRCSGLKKLSCSSCAFGPKGLNALLGYCKGLEELSLKRFKGVYNGVDAGFEDDEEGLSLSPPWSWSGSESLKVLCLRDLFVNQRSFEPLIVGSSNLRTLKIVRCLGDWDRVFPVVGMKNKELVEVHLEKLQLSDLAVSGFSGCGKLEILHLLKTSHCSNAGVSMVVESCRALRKIHIDGFRAGRIGDEGLVAVGRCCRELQELVLIGVHVTDLSLGEIGSGCPKLERLALCRSETIGDTEMACIGEKFVALRKLCVKACPVTDVGVEALALGCPRLVKIKMKKCKGVSDQIAEWLRIRRESLAFNLNYENDVLDATVSDHGVQEAVENPPNDAALNGNLSRLALMRTRLVMLASRNLVSCAFRRWYNNDDSFNGNT